MYYFILKKVKKAEEDLMNFYNLHGRKKLEYIWDYYKLHILVILIIIYFLGYISFRFITKKEVLLTVAAVNIEFSDEDVFKLSDSYLLHRGLDIKKYDINFHNSLLSHGDDGVSYEYAYASSMKLLAMMTKSSLDIVIMDEKAYTSFSNNKYLYPLKDLTLSGNVTDRGDAVLTTFLSSEIYIGIIANSRHLEESEKYIDYIVKPGCFEN